MGAGPEQGHAGAGAGAGAAGGGQQGQGVICSQEAACSSNTGTMWAVVPAPGRVVPVVHQPGQCPVLGSGGGSPVELSTALSQSFFLLALSQLKIC